MHMIKNTCQRILADIKTNRLALAVLLIYLLITNLLCGTPCPQAIILGIACPGCGLTRAGFLLFSGQFAAAWNLNPTIYLWVAFLLYCIIMRYVLGCKIPYFFPLAAVVGILTIIRYFWGILHGYMVPVPCEGILGPIVQFVGFYFRKFLHSL